MEEVMARVVGIARMQDGGGDGHRDSEDAGWRR